MELVEGGKTIRASCPLVRGGGIWALLCPQDGETGRVKGGSVEGKGWCGPSGKNSLLLLQATSQKKEELRPVEGGFDWKLLLPGGAKTNALITA